MTEIQCKLCKGWGMIKCESIICNNCNGRADGCYNCKAGYTQHGWKTCTKCYGSGEINN